MRIVRFVSGVCVLFVALGYGHLLHHHFIHSSPEDFHSLEFWGMFVPAALAGIFAIVGGVLLLMRPRK